MDVSTFLLMYKTHCQCILHVIISGNFEEIRDFLLHFWQGFPDHLMSLMRLDIFLDLITICDCILYKTLLDVLIPSLTFEMPEKLLQSVYNTGIHWNAWIQSSLENMPQNVIDAKMTTAKRFSRSLKRCVAFIHLTQVIRPVLKTDAPSFLCRELEVFLQEVPNYSSFPNSEDDITLEQARQLHNLLKNCRLIEVLILTLDKMLLDLKGWKERDKDEARNFLFNWIYMLSKISYILTENQSRYFTTFHLLSALIQEYILLAVENQLDKEEDEHLYSRFKKHLKNPGNITSNPVFRSPKSYHGMNCASQNKTKYLAKDKSKILLTNTEHSEFLRMNECYPHNIGFYPKACIYYSRPETYPQPLPSCKYASSSYRVSSTYYNNPSSFKIESHTNERCINDLSQQYPTTFQPCTVSSGTDRVFSSSAALNIPQLEVFPTERNPCCPNAGMRRDSASGNDGSYMDLTASLFQPHC